MDYSVLIIEDELILARKIAKYLGQHGLETELAHDGAAGLAALERFQPDAVVLDFNLPGALNGLQLLERLLQLDPTVRVVMVTGFGNVRLAVDAIKAGACDYLSKPVILSELKLTLDKAIDQQRQQRQLDYLRDRVVAPQGAAALIGDSPAMQALRQRIATLVAAQQRLAQGPPPAVLISGETGTGKQLVAKALHLDGPRAQRPFIELNAATLPAQLVESELFGYERGAFTDASQRKAGLIEAANGGTLFLDEIGEMPLELQAKLLKLLEDHSIRRLGSVREKQVDLQVITATNRDLDSMVEQGRFRADLYYRLNTLTIELPPLRQRHGDLAQLSGHLIAQLGKRYGKPGISLTPAALARLQDYPWPGNVRELRNVLEQAVLLCPGEQLEADTLNLPQTQLQSRAPTTLGDATAIEQPQTLAEIEQRTINATLDQVDGNVSKAARLLGLSRDQLRYRLQKYQSED